MLTALERGVKGGTWFSLIDKVHTRKGLSAAFARVKANGGSAGVDHETIAMFETRLEDNLQRLHDLLRRDEYRPQAIRRVYIPKAGTTERRPLGIPTVWDRVVQTALRAVLEPIFEVGFAEQSYGFRPGRDCKDALRRVDELLKQGHCWVVDADLKSYFDLIPHDRLMERVKERIADSRVLQLIEAFLKQRVLETTKGWTPERGSPQGAVISPLLSNIYLNPLDHLLASEGLQMVRYADDFVILCRTEAEAQRALRLVEQWTTSNGLQLHPTKTRLVDTASGGGFDFLGYHFRDGRHWPGERAHRQLKQAIRAKTPRKRGDSMQEIVDDVNRSLRGWFEYFKHCRSSQFVPLDGWVRMRLRSILRKRHHGRGRGRGLDHFRWPNAHFTALGLYSMSAAHAAARQSAPR